MRIRNLSQGRLFTFRKQQPTLDLSSKDPVFCPQIFVPQQQFFIDHSGDVGQHVRPKYLGFPLNLQPVKAKLWTLFFSRRSPFEVSLWKAASYATQLV
jgi:hypothetical protein